MSNPADICRECTSNETTQCMQELIDKVAGLAQRELKLLQKVQLLEQAGTRLSNRIIDVLDNIIDESALLDALEKWDKAKEEAE